MPAKSQKQQRFMGMIHAIQKGDLDVSKVSPSMRKVAKNMKEKDAKDFAETKHKGLPQKVKEVLTFKQFFDKTTSLQELTQEVKISTYMDNNVRDIKTLIKQRMFETEAGSHLYDMVYTMIPNPDDRFIVTTGKQGSSYVGIVVTEYTPKKPALISNIFVKSKFRGMGWGKKILLQHEAKIVELFGKKTKIVGNRQFKQVADRSFVILKTTVG